MNESLNLTINADEVWTCINQHSNLKEGACITCGEPLVKLIFARPWDPAKNEEMVRLQQEEGHRDYPVNPSQ